MGRRGHGEGSVYKRADGYWVAAAEAGRTPDGRRRRVRVVRKRKADVLQALAELKRQADEGALPDRSATVASLLDFWLAEVASPGITAGTLKEYKVRIGRIVPAIGHIRLAKLGVPHCQALANDLGRKYSVGTARNTLTTLRTALDWAVGADLLAKNPAKYASLGRAPATRVDDTLQPAEVDAVLAAAAGTDMEALAVLALRYGLRLGELLALRWDDVDLDGGELSVRKSKTQAGERSLPLLPEVASVLRAHRARAARIGGQGYVFPNRHGGQTEPGAVRAAWNGLLAQAGVEHRCRSCGTEARCSASVRRFHASRHTAATSLLAAGVPLEVVSAILGHSAIAITANTYARVRADAKRSGLSALTKVSPLE